MKNKKSDKTNDTIEKINGEFVESDKNVKIEKNPYQTNGVLSKIPYWVKAIFIKYWFFGAVCFFVGMGFGLSGDLYALVAGLLSGALTDIACDNILIMMDSDEHESRMFMMCKSKRIWSFIVNIIYAIGIYFGVAYFCDWMVSLIYNPDSWFLSNLFAGPLSQGLVALIIDLICIGIKDLIVYLVKKNKKVVKE